ncbi:transcriptional regulator NrdR [Candidatus Pacearchaeota archaeon]|nr:transcriptional regulator NrdR [Candidatus Pacearchaeota archaeon]
MECPFCSSKKSKVTDKRTSPNKEIRRRRECLKCGKRFTTYEKILNNGLIIIKKDGSKQEFDKEKLEKGIRKALEKRPVEEEIINKMVCEIEKNLRKRKGNFIKSQIIGELVSKKLKKLDQVAYVRFASVYRGFEDAKDFKTILKEV